MSYDDPRLAVVYDVDNPDGPDHDYFRSFVGGATADVVTDLGCGTGILTVTLARAGRTVIGIDPAPAMLERAAARPGGRGVEWLLGTSEQIAPESTDVVLMTGNVAMHILGDDWHRTLADIARGLRPGGRLAFETRNPLARAWESWNHPLTERETPVGRLRESGTTSPPDESGVVTTHYVNEFVEDGLIIEGTQRLQFRDLERVRTDLTSAGLEVQHVWRDWHRTPFSNTSLEPLMVFETRQSATRA
ncbi:MAG: class I SAM-dependent methyltransferase [Intrasporangiaceae bacterium]|nr:class I SAM-dependent methyltransferase [Intrasporangiaceae bacterium]